MGNFFVSLFAYFVMISIMYVFINNYGFKSTWALCAAFILIVNLLQNRGTPSLGYILGLGLGTAITSLIDTGICMLIYKKTTVYWSYALLSTVLILGTTMLLGTAIGGAMSSTMTIGMI